MFGLTFEKLMLIAVIAAFLLGPQRLPHYAGKLAEFARFIRSSANGAKDRLSDELGPDFDDIDWKKLDPRQYDPRRIIRDALTDDPGPALRVTPTAHPPRDGDPSDVRKPQRLAPADRARRDPAPVRSDPAPGPVPERRAVDADLPQ